jgi:precorrin-4 methylase
MQRDGVGDSYVAFAYATTHLEQSDIPYVMVSDLTRRTGPAAQLDREWGS